ncbi:MAG: D-alanyl-D-alanine carboxypeptidase [Tissierellia bacterium]|nr:D-alanyl-D-alanine carboxypeptidase [Tissierellia bacterium]
MLKKILIYFSIFTIILLNINKVEAQPSILSKTAVLIDAESGTILAQKDADKKMYPASLTKIMTAIIAIEMGNLTDVITIDDDTPYEIDGSHVALEPGEILTLKDLLYALLLPSANDAASAIAKHYGKTTENFVKLMNDKAKELGAYNTNFVNPHGLHDDNHYTTAYDLALITKYAMKNETFRNIVSTEKYEIKPTNKKDEPRFFTNLNKMLYCGTSSQIYVDGMWISPLYDNTTGVKTGYTPEAGNTLVASAKKNNTELIAVILKGVSLEMYQDAHNLFNYGFESFQNATLAYKNTYIQNLTINNGDIKEISLITENDFNALLEKDYIPNVKSKIIIDDITLPLKKNDVIGKIEYSIEGKILGSVNLITPTPVNSTIVEDTKSNSFFKTLLKLLFVLALILISFRIYNTIRIKLNRKRRRKKYRVDI